MPLLVWTPDDVLAIETMAEWEALSVGVVYVVEFRPTGRGMFSGGDWYQLMARPRGPNLGHMRYVPSGEWGTTQSKPRGPSHRIKEGVPVSDEAFARIEREAWEATWPR